MEMTTQIGEELGADRVSEPRGTLPQRALRLDPSAPMRAHELELAVERLCLDSTSHREIRERCAGDPQRMAARVLEIVAERGKLHNPDTDSGGILMGTVAAAGEGYPQAPPVGERVATLGSLTLTPLRLDEIADLDPASPQIGVRGTAYVFPRASVAAIPDDLPEHVALDLFDVCAAASQTEELVEPGDVVYVLGVGHAGQLAMAAAREAAATVVAVDVDAAALDRAERAGLCDLAVVADLRDPVAAVEAVRAAGAPPAQLTVVVVNATDCEPAALLMTADEGTILFFSMATSFSGAALAADGIGTAARMVVGSGMASDRGELAIRLARTSAPLRAVLGL
jgi:L-erythro-3,5-diaminohexanoate dehydrogenase